MPELDSLLARHPAARAALLPQTLKNIGLVYQTDSMPDWARHSIEELFAGQEWTELNDRFYRTLTFGTGGIRGRTIGKVVTRSERGDAPSGAKPQHAGVGTNMLNTANIGWAAECLGVYLRNHFKSASTVNVVISHDTRHFSRDFALKAATVLGRLGLQSFLFEEDRPTPLLSYAVRWLNAQAGIMITASHNPYHDNGFKAYFEDGAQLVEPHASRVIETSRELNTQTGGSRAVPVAYKLVDSRCEQDYLESVSALVLEPQAIEQTGKQLKIVYSPIHGTGRHVVPRLLERFKFNFSVVESQNTPDGNFPTVKSPNPENAEALAMAIGQANAMGADLVLATDPDDDRMGAAVRGPNGNMELLTGNQIGSLLAYYRAERLFAQGVLSDSNKKHAAIIKTLVTTDLQEKIGLHFGVRCINTLTGFKYIGEKMLEYEKACGLPNYSSATPEERRKAQLERGTFVIFAGEESYGYSGGDYVRDKDGNAGCLMLAELAAWAKSQNQTVIEYLDAIYRKLGYYAEKLGTLTMEGAQGAEKIAQLLKSYREQPPKEFLGIRISKLEDYEKQDFADADGKKLPKELLLIFHLEGGHRMAVRGSGTEPKIKFYFFTQAEAGGDLETVKHERREFLDRWWAHIQADAAKRVP
jgi:phosphoglucomutase